MKRPSCDCDDGWVMEDGKANEPCRTCNPDGYYGEGPTACYGECEDPDCHGGWECVFTGHSVGSDPEAIVDNYGWVPHGCNPIGYWGSPPEVSR